MIIGIDISQIAYPGTGVARYVKALLMNMLPDKSYKYHCFFSSLRGTIPPDIISLIKKTDTKITKLPIPPTLLSWLWNDKHIISIDHFLPDADIIITSDWTEPPSEKIKITIVHDMVIYKHPETTTQKTAWSNDAFAPLPNIAATQKKRLHWVQKESRLILADSYSTKKDVVDILSTDGQRVEVVYPSVMIKKPSRADLQRVQKKYKIAKPFLFTIGKQEPRKNIGRLASVFTSLAEPDLELLIAGPSGWGDPVIVDNKRIRQLGYVEEHDLASLYQLSLGCVFPSLYEGFGYPVAEAITLGIPVACSNNSSLGEIAGDAAITFDPHSPEDMKRGLKSLVHDTALRNTIVKNCTARSNLFTPEHFRMQLLSLIKAL